MDSGNKDEQVKTKAVEYDIFVGGTFYKVLFNTPNRKARRSQHPSFLARQKLFTAAVEPSVQVVVNAINKKQALWDALFKRAGITA